MNNLPDALNAKLNELYEQNKARGIVTYNDVMNQLMDTELDPDQLESVLEQLESLGVRIVSDSDVQKTSDVPDPDPELSVDPHKPVSNVSDEVNMSDPVRMYLKEIGKIPLLTAEQEVDLAKRIEKGAKAQTELDSAAAQGTELSAEEKKALEADVADGASAKEQLIEANLRLVVSIAGHYNNRGMLYLDLIQEGNMGLIKAADKFDYSKGFKFSTYATWWIRQSITRALADQARTIRIPVHMVETINRLIRTSRQLMQELGREPTTAELAEAMHLSESRVGEIIKIAQDPVSLETPIGEEEDSHLGDFIPDESAPAPADAAYYTLQREQLMEVLDTLSEREKKVLILRYGLEGGRSYTLEEVGEQFHVTRERIRQIEAKALRKLKVNKVIRGMRD